MMVLCIWHHQNLPPTEMEEIFIGIEQNQICWHSKKMGITHD